MDLTVQAGGVNEFSPVVCAADPSTSGRKTNVAEPAGNLVLRGVFPSFLPSIQTDERVGDETNVSSTAPSASTAAGTRGDWAAAGESIRIVASTDAVRLGMDRPAWKLFPPPAAARKESRERPLPGRSIEWRVAIAQPSAILQAGPGGGSLQRKNVTFRLCFVKACLYKVLSELRDLERTAALRVSHQIRPSEHRRLDTAMPSLPPALTHASARA
jgi:hypothetical protein